MTAAFKIEGLGETRRHLAGYGIDIDKAIQRALKSAAKEVIELSSTKVPVQSGNLRDSVYFKMSGDGVEIGYKADYATDVHERTERRGAKFLEQAMNEYKSEFMETFTEELAKALS